jgi:hypothetical protein
MSDVSEQTLARIAEEIHDVEIPFERLAIIRRVVQQALASLEKSAEVGLEDVEPASTYDPAAEH